MLYVDKAVLHGAESVRPTESTALLCIDLRLHRRHMMSLTFQAAERRFSPEPGIEGITCASETSKCLACSLKCTCRGSEAARALNRGCCRSYPCMHALAWTQPCYALYQVQDENSVPCRCIGFQQRRAGDLIRRLRNPSPSSKRGRLQNDIPGT